MRKLVLCVAFLVACGGGGDPAAYEGNWIAQVSDACVVGVNIDGEQLRYGLLCPRSANAVDVEALNGVITASSGDSFTVRYTEGTCPTVDAQVETIRYSASGDTLSLLFPEGAVVFARNDAAGMTTGLVATNGCFDDDGGFAPMPLRAY
jgi:hypothetical protein